MNTAWQSVYSFLITDKKKDGGKKKKWVCDVQWGIEPF